MGERIRRERRVEFAASLGEAHEPGEPVSTLAEVIAHRPGDILVPPGRHERLDGEVGAGVPPPRQPPAGKEKQGGDRHVGLGGEQVSELPPAMRPQRVREQIRFGGEVRVQRAVADARGRGDAGYPGAVEPLLGEHVGSRPQQAFAGVGGGDTGDAPHEQIKKTFI